MDGDARGDSRGAAGWVEVAGYFYRHEAELARSLLAANGIEAIVVSDDAGGQGLGLQYVNGAHVMVPAGDAALAVQIMAGAAESPATSENGEEGAPLV